MFFRRPTTGVAKHLILGEQNLLPPPRTTRHWSPRRENLRVPLLPYVLWGMLVGWEFPPPQKLASFDLPCVLEAQRWEDSPFPDDLPIFQWRFSAKHVDYIYLAGPEGNLKWETSARCIVFTRNDWGFALQCQMTPSFTLQCQMISRLYRNIGTATVMSSIVLVTGNGGGGAFPTYSIVWLLDSVWCVAVNEAIKRTVY